MPKIDFSRARLMHRNWRTRLKLYFEGEKALPDEEVLYHEDCQMGRWLYSEGMITYDSIPDMRKLEKVHARLHNHVRSYLELRKVGNLQLCERELNKIEELSEEIMVLLTEIEKTIS